MALLAQLQLPAVLAQQILVVAVDLLNGLADLVGDRQRGQAGQAALPNCPHPIPPGAESLKGTVTPHILPVTPLGRFCYQSHFTEEETEPRRG